MDPLQECQQHCLGRRQVRVCSTNPGRVTCTLHPLQEFEARLPEYGYTTTWAEPVWTDKKALQPLRRKEGASYSGHLILSWGSKVCHLLPEFLHCSSQNNQTQATNEHLPWRKVQEQGGGVLAPSPSCTSKLVLQSHSDQHLWSALL